VPLAQERGQLLGGAVVALGQQRTALVASPGQPGRDTAAVRLRLSRARLAPLPPELLDGLEGDGEALSNLGL
jgi:hypothetical protein